MAAALAEAEERARHGFHFNGASRHELERRQAEMLVEQDDCAQAVRVSFERVARIGAAGKMVDLFRQRTDAASTTLLGRRRPGFHRQEVDRDFDRGSLVEARQAGSRSILSTTAGLAIRRAM